MNDTEEGDNGRGEEQVGTSRDGEGLLHSGEANGKLAEALLMVLERQDEIETRIKEVYACVLRIEQKIDELLENKNHAASLELEYPASTQEVEPPLTQPSAKRKYTSRGHHTVS